MTGIKKQLLLLIQSYSSWLLKKKKFDGKANSTNEKFGCRIQEKLKKNDQPFKAKYKFYDMIHFCLTSGISSDLPSIHQICTSDGRYQNLTSDLSGVYSMTKILSSDNTDQNQQSSFFVLFTQFKAE